MAQTMEIILITVFLSAVLGQSNRGNQWNPFQSPFNFNTNFASAPAGFAQFPSFGGFSNNPGFNFGSFANNAAPSVADASNSGRGGSSFGGSNFGTSNFGNFDFSKQFDNFNNQFAQQFPSFWPSGSNSNSAGTGNTGSNSGAATTRSTATQATVSVTSTVTSTATSVLTTLQSVQTTSPNSNVFVSSRNCTSEGATIGISSSSNDQCGSVECQCFKGFYLCYSTCSPPPAGQQCTAVVDTTSTNICPRYSNCAASTNASAENPNIFRCSSGPVHASICWMYEIVFGKLTEPLGFFESVSQGCPLATQCVCGPSGFVQPANFKPEDFKTPANNQVFPRKTAGNKGAFANST